jgi:2-polyprenyl-3-methyl-5-hydroxy-6-metoxy-1,4-benzoquinol methylase
MHVKYPYDFELHLDDPVSTHAVQFRLVPEGSYLLDVGCHTGILGEALTQRKGCTVVGIDLDESVVKVARTRLHRAETANIENRGWTQPLRDNVLAQDGASGFDVILFGDVLEHTRDPSAILEEARELLAEGGRVIVSVPNVANLRVRIALFLGNFDYKDAGILDWGHLRFFTRRTAREMMEKAGFAITKQEYSGYSLPKWLIYRFPELLSVNVILVGEPKKPEEEETEDEADQPEEANATA